ncbi:MAG: hypothetical protein ACTSQK_01085 [Candidatus Heimdallarchaeota archaeon]
MVSEEEIIEKPKSRKKGLYHNIIFCPYCGKATDNKLLLIEQTSICLECDQDMNIILLEARSKRQFDQKCIVCSYDNPTGAQYCIKCSSSKFSEKKKSKSKFLNRQSLIILGISFLISLGVSLGLVFGIASEYIIVKNIIAVLTIIPFTLIFSWFFFVLIRVFTKKEGRKN